MKKTVLTLLLPLLGQGASLAQTPAPIDLAQALAEHQLVAVRRTVAPLTDGTRRGIRVSEQRGEGLVQVKELRLGLGTISFEVRGQDVLQRSFVGVAFHGQNDSTYEAVYFRPFNFHAADSVRRVHAVQYIAQPRFSWSRLRTERNGQFEQPLPQAPDPNGWFRARVEVGAARVRVFLNERPTPVLDVPRLQTATTGWVGLFMGDGSGGDFANLVVRPAGMNASLNEE